MKSLIVKEVNKELRIDSRDLCEPLGVQHKNIVGLIREYGSEFKELGPLVFKDTKIKTAGGMQQSTFAYLNEDQSYYLLVLVRNTAKARGLKLNLIKAFREARDNFVNKQAARLQGKVVRKAETKYIEELVKYAKDDGSINADKYYMLLTKMTLDVLGLKAGQRNEMDASELYKISTAEAVVGKAISDGIATNMYYKDIYKLAKQRVEGLQVLLPSS